MSKLFIIVERKEDWTSYYPSEDVVTAQEYLELPIDDDTGKRVQVINLCRHYKYLRHGYYCSLLAEARGHKVIPSVRTISELARKSLYSLVLEDLDRTLDKALAAHPYGSTDGFTLTLYFGSYRHRAVAGPGATVVRGVSLPVAAGGVQAQPHLAHRGHQARRHPQAARGSGGPLRQRPGQLQPADLAQAAFAQAVPLRPGDPPRPRRGVPAVRCQGAEELRAGPTAASASTST